MVLSQTSFEGQPTFSLASMIIVDATNYPAWCTNTTATESIPQTTPSSITVLFFNLVNKRNVALIQKLQPGGLKPCEISFGRFQEIEGWLSGNRFELSTSICIIQLCLTGFFHPRFPLATTMTQPFFNFYYRGNVKMNNRRSNTYVHLHALRPK